jgi:hypothetical protein
MEQLTPGARVLCRDAEWLVTRKEPVSADNSRFAIHCLGVDDLVRGHEAIFLTDLDELEPIDPRDTELVPDMSGGCKLSKLPTFGPVDSCLDESSGVRPTRCWGSNEITFLHGHHCLTSPFG